MMNKLTAVITGDIIESRKVMSKEWMEPFKKILNQLGSKNKSWEIYRGDSFQLEIIPEMAFEALLLLKSTIKQNKLIDVRIAIGIGEKDFKTAKITESNGSAFVRAGYCFDNLKKHTMGISMERSELDTTLNLMFELAALTMNKWTENTAFIIQQTLLNPAIGQKELEQKLNLLQSSISRGLKRGGYDEIQKLNTFYKKTINNL